MRLHFESQCANTHCILHILSSIYMVMLKTRDMDWPIYVTVSETLYQQPSTWSRSNQSQPNAYNHQLTVSFRLFSVILWTIDREWLSWVFCLLSFVHDLDAIACISIQLFLRMHDLTGFLHSLFHPFVDDTSLTTTSFFFCCLLFRFFWIFCIHIIVLFFFLLILNKLNVHNWTRTPS